MSLDSVQNLSREWGLDTTLEDLRDWAAESQFGQTGPPNVPFSPKSQVTVDSLHAKLRIVRKLVEQLIDEAALLDQEMAATTLALKLSEDELQVFVKYSTEINEQISEHFTLFNRTSAELTVKATEEDTVLTLDKS